LIELLLEAKFKVFNYIVATRFSGRGSHRVIKVLPRTSANVLFIDELIIS
jgi:hypothetical protein